LAPAHLRAEGLAQVDFARERAQRAIDAKQALDRLTSPTPTPPTPGGKTDAQPANNGYKERDRGEIDRLIQNTR
jgi:membrane protein required for colicin V production